MDFSTRIGRLGTNCLKWDSYDPDVIPLWLADMDFQSPEPVRRALMERVDHGIFGYPLSISCEMKQTIVERLYRLYDWKIAPEDIIPLPGVIAGFNLVCQALCPPGKSVLIQTPVYPPIREIAQNAGLFPQEADLIKVDGIFQIDLDRFKNTITPNTGIFILCNPHNPVGRVFTRSELDHLSEICLSHNLYICSDEIHCDLLYDHHHHIPIATLDHEIAQRTVTLFSPSKTFNLAGLSFAFAVTQNESIRRSLQNAKRGLVDWVNIFGQTAALTAYKEGQPWLDELLKYLTANRDYLISYIQSYLPKISMSVPEGTYLAWLDCNQSGIECNPQEFFLEKARVALNDGSKFGSSGSGFVRINYGCPRETLEIGLDRMRIAINNY